jgi:hypothetical protein
MFLTQTVILDFTKNSVLDEDMNKCNPVTYVCTFLKFFILFQKHYCR